MRADRRGRARRPNLILAVLATCGTVTSLQQTTIIPLVPQLPELLGTTPAGASWMVTVVLLSGAVATPVVTRLADTYGKRRLIVASLAVMVVGSAVGAFADTLTVGIVARALQGVGVALVPVAIGAMRDELPAEKVPLGVAVMSATLAVGAGAGLPVSGVIVAHLGWHAIFWVTGVAGLLVLVAVPLALGPSRPGTARGFDVPGTLLLSAGLVGVLLALTQGAGWGWGSPATIACATGGLVLLVLLIPVQLRVRTPLVDVRVARRPAILLVNLTALLLGFAMFVNLLISAQLLQLPVETGYGLGFGSAAAGVWLAPGAIAFGFMAPLAATIIRRIGAGAALFIGSAEMCAAYAWRAFFSHELWQIVTGSMLVTIGTSLAYAAMPVLLIGSVPAGETSSANGLNTLLRSIGTAGSSAAAAAITSAALLQVNGVAHPSFGGFMTVFAMAAGAAGAAAVVAAFRWWIRSAAPVDAAAATTSRPPEPALRAGPTRS